MSWASKVEKKLSSLTETASKESIQTVSKWLGFNRKHSDAITSSLLKPLQDASSSPARKWLYWQIVHEVLVLNASDPDAKKWDRLQDFRTAIGESVVVPSIDAAKADGLASKITSGFLPQWDDLNSFGGPTLIAQIKRNFSSSSASPKPAAKPKVAVVVSEMAPPVPVASPTKVPEASAQAPETPVKEKIADDKNETEVEATPSKASPETSELKAKTPSKKRQSLSVKDINYDFESKGIPRGEVDAREFLGPCGVIATFQIARDLRNDGAVQLGSLLDKVPEDIKKVAAESKAARDRGEEYEIPEQDARDYSMRMSEELLDMDMDEQIQNVQTFRDLVEKQRAAREQLIHLLIKSRCKFGDDDTAVSAEKAEEAKKILRERKRRLMDAMELEGLDFEAAEDEEDGDGMDGKRQKITA